MKKLFFIFMLPGSLALAAVISGSPEKDVREYDGLGIEKLHIENTSGRITISVADRPRVFITATKVTFPEKCAFITEKSDFSEVIVRVERPVGLDCKVDLDIQIPKEMNLNVWSGSGHIDITGIEGDLAFNVGSGSVTANGKFSKIEGKSGSGNVTINGVNGGGNLSVGSGSVDLRMLENVQGALDVKTGSGDANLAFAKGSRIKAELATGSGNLSNEIDTSDRADYGISVKTGTGDLKVKAY